MLKVNPSIFRAYDIRGVFPDEINEKFAYLLGKALVKFSQKKAIIVGRDMRSSSDNLFISLAKGIKEQGVDVIDLGLCSTPLFNFALFSNKLTSFGVMITASHNPKEYNGFKIADRKLGSIGLKNGLEKIKKILEKEDFVSLAKKKGKTIKRNFLRAYQKKVFSLVDKSLLSDFKIIADCGNGMAFLTLKGISQRINSKIIFLYPQPNGNFPHHQPNPIKTETLKDLINKVRREKADLGVAFDGDADRVGFVDEKGNYVSADIIIILLAQELLKKYPGGKVLYDLRSSRLVKEKIKEAGGIPLKSKVGRTFIIERMRKEKIIFGGELSCHFYFRDFYYSECPDLVLLKILEILKKKRKSFSQLIKSLKKYYQSGEINFRVKDKEKLIERLSKLYRKKTKQSFLDGLTCETKDWWFNLRPSNTEPLVRLNIEANTPELLKEKKEELIKIIKKFAL